MKKGKKKKTKKKGAARRASAPRVVLINSGKPKKKGAKRKGGTKRKAKKRRSSARRPAVQVVQVRSNRSRKGKRSRRKNGATSTGLQIIGGGLATVLVGYGVDQLNIDPKFQALLAGGAELAIGGGCLAAGAVPAGAAALGAGIQQTADRVRFLMQRAAATTPQTATKQVGVGNIRMRTGNVAQATDRAQRSAAGV